MDILTDMDQKETVRTEEHCTGGYVRADVPITLIISTSALIDLIILYKKHKIETARRSDWRTHTTHTHTHKHTQKVTLIVLLQYFITGKLCSTDSGSQFTEGTRFF